MTLDQIVTAVATRLNLTSAVAITRIENDVRERYNWVLGAIGMRTSNQGVVTADTVVDYRYVTFYGCQKLLSVFNAAGRTLSQVAFDELRNRAVGSDPPRAYAISTINDDSTTIFLDCIPGSIYTLSADALVDAAYLDHGDSPAFSVLYHDILVYGAKAIELAKMEKPGLADEEEAKFQSRLSELRMFIAKSAYLDIVQGRRASTALTTQLIS